MKVAKWMIALGLGLSITTAQAEKPMTKEVQISLSEAYVPSDKKSNGEAYVIVSGMFPNSCYTFKEARVDHITATEHEVKVFAEVAQTMCLMVLVPFSHEIILGQLESGKHLLRFLNGDGTFFEKTMVVQ